MSKLNGIRVIEIPKFKAVSSGVQQWNDTSTDCVFREWIETHRKLIRMSIYGHAYDFRLSEDEQSVRRSWIFAVEDWVNETDTAPYELIEFEGGMYVVAIVTDDEDMKKVTENTLKWIKESDIFDLDNHPPERGGMYHIIGNENIHEVLGFCQQEIFFPVKFKFGDEK